MPGFRPGATRTRGRAPGRHVTRRVTPAVVTLRSGGRAHASRVRERWQGKRRARSRGTFPPTITTAVRRAAPQPVTRCRCARGRGAEIGALPAEPRHVCTPRTVKPRAGRLGPPRAHPRLASRAATVTGARGRGAPRSRAPPPRRAQPIRSAGPAPAPSPLVRRKESRPKPRPRAPSLPGAWEGRELSLLAIRREDLGGSSSWPRPPRGGHALSTSSSPCSPAGGRGA